VKKIFVFVMFLVVAYFSGGYYLHFMVKQQFAKKELYSNVAASIPFEGTMEFSIPIPYYGLVNKEYEAKEGEFYFKDKYYNVLGSKIVNNVLIISCIANPKTKLLHEELFGFIQDNIMSGSGSSSKKESKTLKLFVPEYAKIGNKCTIFLYDWLSPIKIISTEFSELDQPKKVNSPPPIFS
jgi:hypothetical protein